MTVLGRDLGSHCQHGGQQHGKNVLKRNVKHKEYCETKWLERPAGRFGCSQLLVYIRFCSGSQSDEPDIQRTVWT